MDQQFNSIQFKYLRQLSQNTFYVQHKPTQQNYSLKILTSNEAQPYLSIIRSLDHPCVQRVLAIWAEKGSTYVLCPWNHFGDLEQFLKSQSTFLDEAAVWQLAQQLLEPVAYLHSNRVIHRDLKPANILITPEHHLLISDFGTAIFNSQITAQPFGTPLYQAPEVLKNQKWDQEVDVWALGCILYYIIKLKPPFDGHTLKQLQYNIIFKQPQPLDSTLSVQLRDLLSKMLEKNPLKRISAKDALQVVQDNAKRALADSVIRVNVLSRMRNQDVDKSESTLQLNNSSVRAVDGDLEMSDSDIFPRSPRLLAPEISIDKKPSLPTTQRIENQMMMCTPSRKEEKLDLFSTIKKMRPNSAVGISGKEYIRENLRNEKKENVVEKGSKKQILDIREQKQQEQSLELLKLKQARQGNARKEYIRIHNVPKQFSQQTSRIMRPQTAVASHEEVANPEAEKRSLYALQGKKWTMRIQSATSFRR